MHVRDARAIQLRKTSKEMLVDLYDKYLLPGAPHRRKLTSILVGKAAVETGALASLPVRLVAMKVAKVAILARLAMGRGDAMVA